MALALGFSVNLSMGIAVGQQDPTSIGTGQKPMVIILMDTSASMEFTTAGNERYPRREANTGANLKEWKAGELINEGYRLYGNELQGAATNKRPEQRGPQALACDRVPQSGDRGCGGTLDGVGGERLHRSAPLWITR